MQRICSIKFLFLFSMLFLSDHCVLFPTIAEQLGYSKKDILVITNADDIGLHKDVTDASIKLMEIGVVKSGSIMVPCADFNRTIDIWKKTPSLDFGIHLTLTCEYGEKYPWSPVLSKDEVPSLYNPEGIMWPDIKSLYEHANTNEALMELEAQINKLLQTGMKCSHLDGHMNFYYYNDMLYTGVIQLSCKYNLPLRVCRNKRHKIPFVSNNIYHLKNIGLIFPEKHTGAYKIDTMFLANYYNTILKNFTPGLHSIAIHAVYNTPELLEKIDSLDVIKRYKEFNFWSDNKTISLSQKHGITYINYRPLQNLQKSKLKNSQF